MAPLMERFLACSSVPVLAEPNAGLPELVDGKTVFRLPPEPFAEKTAAFVGMGARLVGGCCGTTPDHIAALRRAVDAVGPCPAPAVTPSGIVLTTRTRLVRVSPAEPFKIIGERINPTGKKDLQAELQAGEYGLAMRFASEQVALGAPILDVNVGRAHGRRGVAPARTRGSASPENTPNRFPSTPHTRKPLPRPCRSAPVPRW